MFVLYNHAPFYRTMAYVYMYVYSKCIYVYVYMYVYSPHVTFVESIWCGVEPVGLNVYPVHNAK